ncbi:unnamed protein product [Cunninghamella echinulata]
MTDISFKEITKDNLKEIGELAVLENQVDSGGNWKIIAESNYHEDAWIRGIYFKEEPVGLIMLSLWEPEEWYAVWKFMIDHRRQKLGIGSKVINMAILEIKKLYPKASVLRLTCRKPSKEQSPYLFYKKLGFIESGVLVDDDIELIKNI